MEHEQDCIDSGLRDYLESGFLVRRKKEIMFCLEALADFIDQYRPRHWKYQTKGMLMMTGVTSLGLLFVLGPLTLIISQAPVIRVMFGIGCSTLIMGLVLTLVSRNNGVVILDQRTHKKIMRIENEIDSWMN